jgi:hypothetical protein
MSEVNWLLGLPGSRGLACIENREKKQAMVEAES